MSQNIKFNINVNYFGDFIDSRDKVLSIITDNHVNNQHNNQQGQKKIKKIISVLLKLKCYSV